MHLRLAEPLEEVPLFYCRESSRSGMLQQMDLTACPFCQPLPPERVVAASDMHEFLFGSERASLAAVKPILLEFQKGDCFYFHRLLRDESPHVDHFIPWSRHPVDLAHNFVLAHATCNSQKSDRLACASHLNAWAAQAERSAPELAREYDSKGVLNDFATSVRIVNWAYTLMFECRGLTWVESDRLEPLPPGRGEALKGLLN